MKKIFFLIIGGALVSCNADKADTNLDEVLVTQIGENFNRNFYFPKESEDSLEAIEIYHKIEEYFIFKSILKSKSRSDYLKFYEKYISRDADVDLSCLLDTYPSVEFTFLPNNTTYIFKNFEEVKKLQENDKTDKYDRIVNALDKISDGYDLKINRETVSGYINSIDSAEYENNIELRIPMIAFFLSELRFN